MRLFIAICVCAAVLPLGGCFDNYNVSTPDKRREANCPQPQSLTDGQTVINLNNGMTAPQATNFAPVSYQEVYTTENTPCGPVVKKAIVPIYGSPVQQQFNQGIFNQNGPVQFGPQSCLPVIPNCPPAQPVMPSLTEPVAWFGPTAAPTYSTQTNWY